MHGVVWTIGILRPIRKPNKSKPKQKVSSKIRNLNFTCMAVGQTTY